MLIMIETFQIHVTVFSNLKKKKKNQHNKNSNKKPKKPHNRTTFRL